MERKIGEVFTDGDNKIKVCKCKRDVGCVGCFYNHKDDYCTKELEVAGNCSFVMRDDDLDIIFKKSK